jgi:hypothetical protein
MLHITGKRWSQECGTRADGVQLVLKNTDMVPVHKIIEGMVFVGCTFK